MGFSFRESRLLYSEIIIQNSLLKLKKQQIYSRINSIINDLNKT